MCSWSVFLIYLGLSERKAVPVAREHRSSAIVVSVFACSDFETPTPPPNSKLLIRSRFGEQTPKVSRKGCGFVRRQRNAIVHSRSPIKEIILSPTLSYNAQICGTIKFMIFEASKKCVPGSQRSQCECSDLQSWMIFLLMRDDRNLEEFGDCFERQSLQAMVSHNH